MEIHEEPYEGTTNADLNDLQVQEIREWGRLGWARSEYLTFCPACDADPTEDTGFPNMDEDGCCVACGMDCSIAGLVEAFKTNEEAVRVFRHALVEIRNHTEDPASEITASIALSEQP